VLPALLDIIYIIGVLGEGLIRVPTAGRSGSDRLDHHATQITGRLEQVLECGAVGVDAGTVTEVGIDILDRRLQAVQTIVQPPEVLHGHDGLARRDLQ
jgi:hypothetical protein